MSDNTNTIERCDACLDAVHESRTHDLKTWPEYYRAIVSGEKRFEYRVNDRDFRVGDVLHLREWNPATQSYTGAQIVADVTYVLSVGDHVVMSIRPSPSQESDAGEGLKPCPFCPDGGRPEIHDDLRDLGMVDLPEAYVTCAECCAEGPYYSGDGNIRELAIAAWNRRPTSPDQTRIERTDAVLIAATAAASIVERANRGGTDAATYDGVRDAVMSAMAFFVSDNAAMTTE